MSSQLARKRIPKIQCPSGSEKQRLSDGNQERWPARKAGEGWDARWELPLSPSK